jgi:hypothetical protein
MMRRTHRSALRVRVGAAVGALIAAAVVVVATPEAASALPSVCSSGGAKVHRFTGGGSNDDWDNPANWTHGVPKGNDHIACVPSGFLVVQGAGGNQTINVGQLHLDDDATLFVDSGAALFANGKSPSIWAADSSVPVDGGRIGGRAKIEAKGDVEFSGDSELTTRNVGGGVRFTDPVSGKMLVANNGHITVNGTLSLFTAYRIDLGGQLSIESDGLVAADWDTSMTIRSTGRLFLNGNGGWYQGFKVKGEKKAVLINRGKIFKSQGGSTSVIDAIYQPEDAGTLDVVCCATLAIAGQKRISGSLGQGQSIGTAVCGLEQMTQCSGSTNPAVDVSSVTLEAPGNNGYDAHVQELGNLSDAKDSRAVSNVFYAHIDGLAVDINNPARLELRLGQAEANATPLADVQVAHVDDGTGQMSKVPDCVGGNIPASATYCIERPVQRFGGNTYVTVLTVETSRWHIRRVRADETFAQHAPSAPQTVASTLSPPGDGSGVKLSWGAPTDDGGAAPKYRIYRDGKAVTTAPAGALSLVVKNNGPGNHEFKVKAVNSEGASPFSNATSVTLDKLSKPRQVAGVRGPAGGPLTAGATWQRPEDAGGYVIKSYQVAAFTLGGRLVASVIVGATARKAFLSLRPGQYQLKVRAKNVDKWGPFSTATSPVSPR